VVQHQPQAPNAPFAQRLAVGDQIGDLHHRRRRIEPQRVEPEAHGVGLDVAQAHDHLRLGSRRLGGDQLERRHEVDRRRARRRQLRAQGLSRLTVPADNQDAGAGQRVVIHTQT
jgi:hypothetical protein